jgi:hypothetical protein
MVRGAFRSESSGGFGATLFCLPTSEEFFWAFRNADSIAERLAEMLRENKGELRFSLFALTVKN